MKPLDSSDGAVGSAPIEPDGSLVSRIAPSAPILAEPDASEGEAGGEGSTEAAREPPLVVPTRASQVVPVGTSEAEAEAEKAEAAKAEAAEAEAAEGAAEAAAPRARISDIVPVSSEPAPDPAPAPHARPSEMVPVDPAVRAARAAFRRSEFGETLHGTGFSHEDDEEATTVDAGAALTEEEQLALMRRIQTAMGHSAMEETAPYGTPAPEPVQPMGATPGLEYDSRSPFKQTMLLGLPQLRPQPPSESPPAASSDVGQPAAAEDGSPAEGAASNPPAQPASAEPAHMASLVRVVGPPTQPPPRRVRRAGSSSPDGVNEPDHEAFVLTHPLLPPDGRRSNVPGPPSAPGALAPGSLVAASGASISLSSANLGNGVTSTPSSGGVGVTSTAAAGHAGAGPVANGGYTSNGYANGSSSMGYGNGSVSRGSVPPQLILPPPPRPQDYEPASSPVASRPSPPPLRASIESSGALLRTRPPASLSTASRISAPPPPSLHDLPTSDPFAGFVAPPPSIAQRGLVVVVVALAVVGVCALVAIAFGLLGKTGW